MDRDTLLPPSENLTTTLIAASESSWVLGQAQAGLIEAAEALELAQQRGDAVQQATALLLKGSHELRLGRIEAAIGSLSDAAEVSTKLGDHAGTALALTRIVLAYHNLGLSQQALETSELAVETAKHAGDLALLAGAYTGAGTAQDAVGNHPGALAATNLALELARESGDDQVLFAALNNHADDLTTLAMAQRDVGDLKFMQTAQQAIAAGEEALACAGRLSPYQEALALVNLGDSLRLGDDTAQAQLALVGAIERAHRGGFQSVEFSAKQVSIEVARDLGQPQEARKMLEELLEASIAAEEGRLELDIRRTLSRVLRELGEFEAALDHLERYCELDRQLRTELAATRGRLLGDRVELDRMSRAAELAAKDAETERSRSRKLEREKDALRERTSELLREADQDGLTGLWNRRFAERMGPELMHAAQEHGAPVSVLMIDADDFKPINDNFGHLTGDAVLRRLGELLRLQSRPDDVVARFGGEEFIVMLLATEADDAHEIAERLCATIRRADWSQVMPSGRVTISIGVATIDTASEVASAEDHGFAALLERADGALYVAKQRGRDRVVVAE